MLDDKVLTSNQIFELEKKTTKQGISLTELMERAGTAVYEEIVQYFTPCKVIILCGPGNNGGDGFVVARLLREVNWQVVVACVQNNNKYSRVANKNVQLWQGDIIDIEKIDFNNYDLIVDALFGIGLHRDLDDKYTNLINQTNQTNLPIVSIDIPSGIDADTGKILGAAIKADITITFGYKKPAHIHHGVITNMGSVIVKNIGFRS